MVPCDKVNEFVSPSSYNNLLSTVWSHEHAAALPAAWPFSVKVKPHKVKLPQFIPYFLQWYNAFFLPFPLVPRHLSFFSAFPNRTPRSRSTWVLRQKLVHAVKLTIIEIKQISAIHIEMTPIILWYMLLSSSKQGWFITERIGVGFLKY